MCSLQRFVDKTSSCSPGGGVNLDHLFKEVLVRCLHLFKEVLVRCLHLFKEVLVRCLHLFKEVLVSVFREALLIFPLH